MRWESERHTTSCDSIRVELVEAHARARALNFRYCPGYWWSYQGNCECTNRILQCMGFDVVCNNSPSIQMLPPVDRWNRKNYNPAALSFEVDVRARRVGTRRYVLYQRRCEQGLQHNR